MLSLLEYRRDSSWMLRKMRIWIWGRISDKHDPERISPWKKGSRMTWGFWQIYAATWRGQSLCESGECMADSVMSCLDSYEDEIRESMPTGKTADLLHAVDLLLIIYLLTNALDLQVHWCLWGWFYKWQEALCACDRSGWMHSAESVLQHVMGSHNKSGLSQA